MPTSGNQSTRQRNLPILGSDSAWSQQCFSCGMVRAAQSCPPTLPTPTHSTANLFLRPEQNQNRAGPFSLAELKTHDEVLSGFWKQQGLVIYSWSKIGNRLIFWMEGINCVLSVSRRPDSQGWGLKTAGKKSVVLVVWLGSNWHWDPESAPGPQEQFVFWCLPFPVHKVLVSLRDAWEIKRGFNFTSMCCFFSLPVYSFPLHPSLALEVYF